MTTWRFWRETLERAVKSAAQGVLSLWTVGDAMFNVFELDWRLGLAAAATGAAYSILTSIVSLPVGAEDSPSAIS